MILSITFSIIFFSVAALFLIKFISQAGISLPNNKVFSFICDNKVLSPQKSEISTKEYFKIFLFAFMFRVIILFTYIAKGLFSDSALSFMDYCNSWNLWDSPHYIEIAQQGYAHHIEDGQYLMLVFFPLYPVLIKIFAAMSVTFLRYQIEPDHFGFFLLVFHIIVYSLWVFTVSLLINLISIKYGSNNAFIWIVGIQIFMTALLELVQIFESNLTLTKIFLNVNPIAHLVVGWHTGTIKELKNSLEVTYIRLDFKVTLVTMLAISIFSVIVGMYLVSQHEFLILNANEEGD